MAVSGIQMRRAASVFVSMLYVAGVTCRLPAQEKVAQEVAAEAVPAQENPAQYYGFSGVEIFKLHERAGGLQSGDFNGDGLTDVVVVDNFSSSLRLFLQQSAEKRVAAKPQSINDLPSDGRFAERKLPMDRAIAALVHGDFNGDQRLDLAVVGAPDQLAIRYQPAPGQTEWTEKWTVRLPGLEQVASIMGAGDLNSDGRTDIVVTGKDVTWVIFQADNGTMRAPESLLNTSERPGLVQVDDLNGDGRDDLSYVVGEANSRSVAVRLQTPEGRIGPETTFSTESPRAVTIADVDGNPGAEVVTVESRSGRLVISTLQPAKQQEQGIPEQLLRYGIGPGDSGRDRAVVAGDFDGDGRTDVLVNDSAQARLLLYRQNGADGLGMADVYPALLGITDLAAEDIDGDGRLDAVLLSSKEGVLATSHFQDGRLSFPETILKKPEGWELAAVATLKQASGVQLVVGLSQGSGATQKLEYQHFGRAATGEWKRVEEQRQLELSGAIGSKGVRLVPMDVNADGRQDLLSIAAGAAKNGVQILMQSEDGSLSVAEQKSQLDVGVTAPGRTSVRGNQLLVARDSFARLLRYSEAGWKVEDQLNAEEASASLEGVVAMNLDGVAGDEIVLVDTGVRKLRILRSEQNVYRPWKEVELGSVQCSSTMVADFNGDARDDLLLMGAQQFAVMYCGRSDVTLKELASFESTREKAFPVDVTVGDVNGDGEVDLTMIDTSIDGLAILKLNLKSGIEEVTHFRVFEEKRLVSAAAERGVQPRESLVVDVTGDGRADLLLLCHDRLLLYPQDTGEHQGQPVESSKSGQVGETGGAVQ